MPETVTHPCQYTTLMASHVLLLPWCMVIAGYQISNDNGNSNDYQPLATNKQANCQ